MTEGVRIACAVPLTLGAALLFTELARRLAIRTHFLDHPVGYKGHSRATPYLGGLAVVFAMLAGWTVVGGAWSSYWALSVSLVVLLGVGLLDDRVGLLILPRLLAQVGAALTLWATHLGWTGYGDQATDLLLTIVWVVGIVNAFNLMDNLDGAAATVAAAAAVGIGILAFAHGQQVVGGYAIVLVAACVGFLRFNLANPARIFLGDGGSMPLGLAVAALVMATPAGSTHWSDILAAVPLVAVPILDTTLVVFSRLRRGVTVLEGARDHTTHRLLDVLGTSGRVAAALGAVQLLLSALGIALYALPPATVVAVSVIYLGLGCAAIVVLDHPGWLPDVARQEIPEHASADLVGVPPS